jgi:YceI-like domain
LASRRRLTTKESPLTRSAVSSDSCRKGRSIFRRCAWAHWVNAPIANGIIDEASAIPSVRFVVDAAKLTVMADKNLSAKELAEVQSNMQNKIRIIEVSQIAFQSTRVQRVEVDAWKVAGNLTLHGVVRPVIIDIGRENGAYVGTAHIKQSHFGIHPIQVGGGLVKVKDELEIRFQVFTRSAHERSYQSRSLLQKVILQWGFVLRNPHIGGRNLPFYLLPFGTDGSMSLVCYIKLQVESTSKLI